MKEIIRKTFNPLRELIEDTRTVGVLLILCIVLSILLSNLSSGLAYREFWHSNSHVLENLSLPGNGSE